MYQYVLHKLDNQWVVQTADGKTAVTVLSRPRAFRYVLRKHPGTTEFWAHVPQQPECEKVHCWQADNLWKLGFSNGKTEYVWSHRTRESAIKRFIARMSGVFMFYVIIPEKVGAK